MSQLLKGRLENGKVDRFATDEIGIQQTSGLDNKHLTVALSILHCNLCGVPKIRLSSGMSLREAIENLQLSFLTTTEIKTTS